VTEAAPRYDAIVIGGGVGGLVAAAHLAAGGFARSRLRVVLVEARNMLGGTAENLPFGDGFRGPVGGHAIYALDPASIGKLRLARRGLAFAERDMALVALRQGGRHIVLTRDVYACRATIAAHDTGDADRFPRFRREAFALARHMRSFWDGTAGAAADERPVLDRLARLSAAAWLDGWFASDALKAALAFDATSCGFSPLEPGSALALIWRWGLEACGLQGGSAQVAGGPGALAAALAKAAQASGVAIRTGAHVEAILYEGGRVVGVRLSTGEMLAAGVVLSSLDTRRTLLHLLPPEALPFGAAAALGAREGARAPASASVLLALNRPPAFAAGLSARALRGRFVFPERPDAIAEAKGAALTGLMPAELVVEATLPSEADPAHGPISQHVLSALIRFLPAQPAGGWASHRTALKDRLIAALEVFAPGLAQSVVGFEVLTPDDLAARYGDMSSQAADALGRLLAAPETRVRSVVPGLYFCGGAAEPATALSGRAARLAAALARADAKAEARA